MDLIPAILKAFSELTFRKSISLIVIVGVFVIGFVFYERFTSSFSLSRIQKEVELLDKLTDIRSRSLDPASKKICDLLTEQLDAAVNRRSLTPQESSSSTKMFLKITMAVAPWVLLGVIILGDTAKKKQQIRYMSLGFLAIVVLAGAIGAVIPTLWWPYFNLIVYPIVSTVLFVFILSRISSGSDKEKANSSNESEKTGTPLSGSAGTHQ